MADPEAIDVSRQRNVRNAIAEQNAKLGNPTQPLDQEDDDQ